MCVSISQKVSALMQRRGSPSNLFLLRLFSSKASVSDVIAMWTRKIVQQKENSIRDMKEFEKTKQNEQLKNQEISVC